MFKKVISAAMAVTLCMSGAPLVKNICGADLGVRPITASAAFQSYTTRLEAGTLIYTSPTSGVSNSKITVSTLYTIVDESTSGGYVYGKLKSGAGWVRLKAAQNSGPINVNYVKSFPAGTVLYTAPGSGVVAMTLSSAGSYTIVQEQTVSGVKYGKFKSGAGWAVLEGTVVVNPPVQTGYIKTADIQAVCNKYGYRNNRFWTTNGNTSLSSCKQAAYSSAYNGNTYKNWNSFSYLGCSQCYGFADYVMANVASNKSGKTVELPGCQRDWAYGSVHNGFRKLTASAAGTLKVGDIVRAGDKTKPPYNQGDAREDKHSAIVYSVDANGNATFLECWGASGQINISPSFSYAGPKNLNDLVNYGFYYILRYEG